MDVLRSFPDNKDFIPEHLTMILRSIAYNYSDSASYCQGMNYLAGAFLLYYKDDTVAFKLVCQL